MQIKRSVAVLDIDVARAVAEQRVYKKHQVLHFLKVVRVADQAKVDYAAMKITNQHHYFVHLATDFVKLFPMGSKLGLLNDGINIAGIYLVTCYYVSIFLVNLHFKLLGPRQRIRIGRIPIQGLTFLAVSIALRVVFSR